MNTKQFSFLIMLIFPVLISASHFGMSLILGGTLFILIMLSWFLFSFLSQFFPKPFYRPMIAIIVGIEFGIGYSLLRIFDPGMSVLLSFSLPMTAFVAFVLVGLQVEMKREFSEGSIFLLWQGIVGFFLLVLSGMSRELSSLGSLSMSLEQSTKIFSDEVAPRLFPSVLPAGLFFAFALILALFNRYRDKEN